jgi:hypothetical protein
MPLTVHRGNRRQRGRNRLAGEDHAIGVTAYWRERCASQVLAGQPLLWRQRWLRLIG